MKKIFSFIILIAIFGYGVYILIDYVQVLIRKRGLEEKAKESVEYLHAGTTSREKARSDIITHITENNINVDTLEVKIDRNPQFTFVYISYYDSLVFSFFKKSKILYFDYEITETLYVK